MKKLLVWLLAVLASLSLAGSRVWADDEPKQDPSYSDTPAAVSVSDIEALKNRLSALESGAGLGLKVDGWLQLWYTHDSYGTTTAGTSNDYSSSKNQWDAFSVKRAEIVFAGTVGNDPKVTFKLSVDPSQSSFTGIGGTTGTALSYEGTASTNTNVNPFTLVKDLFTQLSYSPYASFIFGQNKLWNALEGRTPSNQLDFNNYSNIDGNAFGNKRDLGVALTGTGIPLGPVQADYYLTVISGAGQSTADNNVDKDIVGRVDFTIENNLLLGVQAYDGWEPTGVRQDIAFEGRWISGGFKAQAEFITGSLNTTDNNSANNSAWTPSLATVKGFTTPTGQITPAGYYLQASYRLGDWRLGARWDGYNFNQQNGTGGGNQEWDTYTIGLDWFQVKDAYKLTLNWEDHLLRGVDEYNVWTLQSQISI